MLSYQNAQLLEDFGMHFERLQRLILEHEADTLIGDWCSCGMYTRTTQCTECIQYTPTCEACFVRLHRLIPTHWAEVWNHKQGFFVRKDISILGHVIQLGHRGNTCPCACATVPFIIVDTNGIHATCLAFCGCLSPDTKVEQLMRAQLFPATMRDPRTAFTFKLLKEFHIHSLESKKAAYGYMGAIQRLTDNAFTAGTPVCPKIN
jgi:hypothetical protein